MTEIAGGWVTDPAVYLWRKHPGRITHPGEREAHLDAALTSVRQRVLAIRELGLTGRLPHR